MVTIEMEAMYRDARYKVRLYPDLMVACFLSRGDAVWPRFYIGLDRELPGYLWSETVGR